MADGKPDNFSECQCGSDEQDYCYIHQCQSRTFPLEVIRETINKRGRIRKVAGGFKVVSGRKS